MSSTTKAQLYLDRQNIRRINQTPVGGYTTITTLLPNGQMKTYDTLVTSNERYELMQKSSQSRKGLRLTEQDLEDVVSSSDDDGFVSEDAAAGSRR